MENQLNKYRGNGIDFAATSFYREDWKVKRKTEERRGVIRKA